MSFSFSSAPAMADSSKGSFTRPRGQSAPTPHLYAANCGPAAGVSFADVAAAFSQHGPVQGVAAADGSGGRAIVSFFSAESAAAARRAWHGRPCLALQGRVMSLEFAEPVLVREREQVQLPVCRDAEEVGIPGLFLHLEFVSEQEEGDLVAAVDARPWQGLAKRRVQHYGYEFLYKVRSVDLDARLGDMPEFVHGLLERILGLEELAAMEEEEEGFPLDQLTVNEYPRGVGLSPHVDTHSAFQGAIISLSLAGPCVMEFRKYGRREGGDEVQRRALFLPPRSLLILSGEARYAWHHYIPHHKLDFVDGLPVDRGSRRVSLTFRKVRAGPCRCRFPEECDSHLTALDALDALQSGGNCR